MRKLALILFSFSAAVFVSEYLLSAEMMLTFAGAAVLGLVIALFLRTGVKKALALIMCGLITGFLYDYTFSSFVIGLTDKLSGEFRSYVAEACSYPTFGDRNNHIDVYILGEGTLPIKARIYVYNESLDNVVPGDILAITSDLSLANTIRDEETDTFFSKGIFLLGSKVGEISITHRDKMPIRYFPLHISKRIKDAILDSFPDDVIALCTALITGDKTLLYNEPQVTASLERAGIYHIVSVSGMHVSMILGLIYLLFGHGKWTILAIAPILLIFMGISGFAPSVVRAVIMQLFLAISQFTEREDDRLTSLSAALFLLLLVNPCSIRSVGLQLSFASTLGIILFANKIFDKLKPSKPVKRSPISSLFFFCASSFATTIGALVFTLPLTAIYFKYISLVSPISNLLILWAVAPAFCITAVSAVTGIFFRPMGVLFGKIAALPVRFVIFSADKLASLYISAVYLENDDIIIWFAVSYFIIALLFMMKVKIPIKTIALSVSVFSLCAVLLYNTLSMDNSEHITAAVLDVGQGQCIVLSCDGNTVVIDCGSSSGEDAGNIASRYIYSLGRNSIDALILTHYHADHANGIRELISRVDVNTIFAPIPEFDESSLDEDIISLASSKDLDIIYVEDDQTLSVGGIEISLFAPMGSLSENERGLCALITQNDFDMLVTGDVDSDIEELLMGKYRFPDIECLIVGHHGARYSTCDDLLIETKPDTAVISVGYNSYGHPAQETIDKLSSFGAKIFRTDINGTVIIRAEEYISE